jgi:hypothetical protein
MLTTKFSFPRLLILKRVINRPNQRICEIFSSFIS